MQKKLTNDFTQHKTEKGLQNHTWPVVKGSCTLSDFKIILNIYLCIVVLAHFVLYVFSHLKIY